MRQLCPYCGKLVDLPVDAAGREVPCPACQRSFAVPKAYAPTVSVDDKPPLPPGLVPPSGPEINAPAHGSEAGIVISARKMNWLGPIALTIALVSALAFSWVGSFPGGIRVFSQSPLDALFAAFTGSSFDTLQADEKAIRENIQWNGLLLPFFLALLAATALAWLTVIYPQPTVTTVPAPLAWLVAFHPRRHFFLIVLTTIALIFILIQCWRGFGLESAVHRIAQTRNSEALNAATTPYEIQKVEIRIGQEIGHFCLQDTLASRIGVWALILGLAFLLIRWWLDRRGDKPEPRLILRC